MQIPATAFAGPDAETVALNPDFWAGYAFAQSSGAINLIPTPAASETSIFTWRTEWAGLLKPVSAVIVNYNVGYNSAMLDAGNYVWLNPPPSTPAPAPTPVPSAPSGF